MADVDDPVETLRRWEAFGATWEVVQRTSEQVTVSLCRCDGGEEVERLVSSDPALRAYVESHPQFSPGPRRADVRRRRRER